MNILIVCSGNISRSFLAGRLLKHEIESLKLDNVSVASAGLFAYSGRPADPRMLDYLAQRGIPAEGHESHQVTNEDVDWADLILVMERSHAEIIESQWPDAAERVELLGKFLSVGLEPDDIIDPFGRSPYHYRLAQAQITMAIGSLVKRLLQDQGRDHA